MTAKGIIVALMKEAGLNQTQLAPMVGMKNQSNVAESLRRDMKISVFLRFIDALGYEVVIRKKTEAAKPDSHYILSNDTVGNILDT